MIIISLWSLQPINFYVCVFLEKMRHGEMKREKFMTINYVRIAHMKKKCRAYNNSKHNPI
jgi:hypothetical protein